jgi:hypothetical protein
MYAYLYDACLPVLCLLTCILSAALMSALLYGLCLPVSCLPSCTMTAQLNNVCLTCFDVCLPVYVWVPVPTTSGYHYNMTPYYLCDICLRVLCLATLPMMPGSLWIGGFKSYKMR